MTAKSRPEKPTLPTMVVKDKRAEFEAWVRTKPGGIDAALNRRDFPGSDRLGQYVNPQVEFAWQAVCALPLQVAAAGEQRALRACLSACDRVIEQGGIFASSRGTTETEDQLDIERLGEPTIESELRYMHEHHPLMNEGYKGSTLWHRVEAALSKVEQKGEAPKAFDAYLCRAWGEADLASAEIVQDWEGVRRFMVREWVGHEGATDADGTVTLERLKEAFDEHDEENNVRGGSYEIGFEIGGVSVERVVGFAAAAAVGPPKGAES
jgi:hypothetical protein